MACARPTYVLIVVLWFGDLNCRSFLFPLIAMCQADSVFWIGDLTYRIAI